MILMGDVVASSGGVRIPLRTVPKVPLPRNSPNSTCFGGIVDDGLCVNTTVVPNSDDDDGGESGGTGGRNADTNDGRRRTSSIGHRRDGTMFSCFFYCHFGVTCALRKKIRWITCLCDTCDMRRIFNTHSQQRANEWRAGNQREVTFFSDLPTAKRSPSGSIDEPLEKFKH